MDSLFSALISLFVPSTLAVILLGIIIGIVFGAIPGLNGVMALTLMLPMTIFMAPSMAIPFLMSIYIGGVSGTFIAAVLVGIPGGPSSIATCWDGYKLTQNGQPAKAMGAGIISSFIGTFFSTIIAALLCPYIAKLAVKLGPWEFFSLCLCAITLVVSISKGNVFKGIAGAGLGLLITTVGIAPIDATQRFTYGNANLYGGINQTAVLLGTFAVAQIAVALGQKTAAMPEVDSSKLRGIGITLNELKDNFINIIRSFMIGLWIGFLPGMGSGLSNMVAYSAAKSGSKHPEKFGTGCVEGIFAPEVANNASIGGAIIPMIALGIPGDTATAVLLSALLLQGVQTGPLMIQNNLSTVNVIYMTVLLSAVIVLILQFFGMRLFPKLLKMPYHYVYGTIIILCFTGAFCATNSVFNCTMMFFASILGLFLYWAEIPTGTTLLAMILGKMIETYLRRGLTYGQHGFFDFVVRPVSGVLLFVALGSLIIPFIKWLKDRKSNNDG
ncbi:MAG: tripartite tricarboxylate transporter permease [Clostridiales bacterium]|nr:tripartite tricarboxylate transporter permease [Clostridiales bacterium]